MITKHNLANALENLGFKKNSKLHIKKFEGFDYELKVDFEKEKIIYPEQIIVHSEEILNFSKNEYFVQFECVHRLLLQGYNPKHIELEPRWQVGHGSSGGRADILIKDNNNKHVLIIECKTCGNEFNRAWEHMQNNAAQLFSYAQQAKSTKFVVLYTSNFVNGSIDCSYYLIKISDNEEYLANNSQLQGFRDAQSANEMYQVWKDTYNKHYDRNGLFEDHKPYEIGIQERRIGDLKNINATDIQKNIMNLQLF